jgi:hypothetical protein
VTEPVEVMRKLAASRSLSLLAPQPAGATPSAFGSPERLVG